MLDETKFDIAAEKLKSIAHPKRIMILAYLTMRGECNVSALQTLTELPQPTLSQHLSRMQRSGVLNKRKKGTGVYYSLKDEKIFEAIQKICGTNFLEIISNSNLV